MPDFHEFSTAVQAKFKIKDEASDFVFYPFKQGLFLRDSGINSGGVCRVLNLFFANARLSRPPKAYEDAIGKYRNTLPDLMKRFDAMQKVAEKGGYYQPSTVPVGADFMELKTKRANLLKLNSISDIIAEIVSQKALYYISLRTGDGQTGHSIAMDTRGPMIMFDPNNGWWEVRNNPTAGGFFKTWFPKWYAEMGYKTDFHGGDRLIYRYT